MHQHVHQSIRPMIMFLAKASDVALPGLQFAKIMDSSRQKIVFPLIDSYLISEVLFEESNTGKSSGI
jgi:hypothetical protein